jgi:hypothetical protein
MATIHPFPPSQALCPDDLRIAADAFEAALQALPAAAHELSPYTARQLLARYVMEKALGGVRDPIRLRDGALAHLDLAATRQTA